MAPTRRTCRVTLLSVLTVVSFLVGATAVGIVPATADEHTKDTAEDFTEEADFSVEFPFTTDHYPGDQNTENGSIQYFAASADAFKEVSDEEGVYLDYVIIDADWIDYSACTTDNTAAFGIDRGNDNDGTKVDEDLVQYQKNVDFRDDGLTVNLYNWDDFANDPPYFEANDAVVAEQGARSSGGSCLTVTSEPGWYQVQGFINGTEADNGKGEEPSESANEAGILAQSNYLYVCECDSRSEAEEKLGKPPGQEESSDPTPTPTATAEPTATESEATATATATAEPTATLEPAETEPAATPTPTATEADDGGNGGGGDAADSNATPTPGAGPGFGAVAALVALLASALLARHH